MKYFKDEQGNVFAYESDGSQDSLIKPGLIGITQQQADALRTPAQAAPSVITMRQARRALFKSGYLSQVDSLIASIPGDEGEEARIDWAKAIEVKRSHPLVSAMAAQ